MAVYRDRLGEILEGHTRRSRILVSPEGVPLDIKVASNGERLAAFLIDMILMGITIICLYLLLIKLFFTRFNFSVGMTLILFLAFLVRNLYFLHFELAWQGRTPGKKICGLRVINRNGGELFPSALIARNLTREVECFLPFSLLLSLGIHANWQSLALFGWSLAVTAMPLFNRGHLRAGDVIGGTQVISMPKRILLGDIVSEKDAVTATHVFTFRPEHLSIYGAFELQVLEEFLRRPPGPDSDRLLDQTCEKICRKIGWTEPIPAREVRRFLTEFYTAERADLERGRLFGQIKEDKGEGGDRKKP